MRRTTVGKKKPKKKPAPIRKKICYECNESKPTTDFDRTMIVCRTCITKRNEEIERRNRETKENYEETMRRHLGQSCPRCSHTPLVVYQHDPDLDGEDVGRYELDPTHGSLHGTIGRHGAMVDSYTFSPGVVHIRTVDRLIYCPNCGALCEIGGEVNYPPNRLTGGPQPVDDDPLSLDQDAPHEPI